jgi:hypothetical protein
VEAARLASPWRCDTLVNGPMWRRSTATASVWCLETPEAAEHVAVALGTRLAAHGLQVTTESLRLTGGDQAIAGCLGSAGNPAALVVRQGEAVGYLVGEELAQVLAHPRCRP